MRKLLGGKNILLILFIISLFSSFFVTNSSNSAFSWSIEEDSVKYTKSMCEEMGLEWGEWGYSVFKRSGCKFRYLEIKDGEYKPGKDYGDGGVLDGGDGGIHRFAAYVPKDASKPCASGFKSEEIKIDNHKDQKACVKIDGLKDEEYGLPPSLTNSDGKDKRVKLDKSNCENYGGFFGYTTNLERTRGEKCAFRKEDGSDVFYDYDTDLPDTFYTYDKNHKCPSGYKEEPDIAGKISVFKCTKLVTNSNGEQVPANDPSVTGKTEDDKDEGKSNCKVDHFGWIVCPGAKAMGSMVSGLYKSIADNFLSVKSGQIFQGDSGAKAAWQSFRDIGNVIFIIAIMAIVISQITGYGISNYGIKKMLPKILVMAILINLSWYVAVIGVDISNILGKGIFNLFTSANNDLIKSTNGGLVENIALILSGSAAAVIGLGVIAMSFGIFFALGVALLALFSFFVILTVRQAVIILLVVVSPLAFACLVFPNMNKYFDKWLSMFKSLLFIYPICSAIMGASILASTILGKSAGGKPFESILFTLIPAMALFTTGTIIKTALSALGALGSTISGKLSGMQKAGANKIRNNDLDNGIKRWGNNTKLMKGINYGFDVKGKRVWKGWKTRHAIADMKQAEFERDEKIRSAESIMASFEGINPKDMTPGQQRSYEGAKRLMDSVQKEKHKEGVEAMSYSIRQDKINPADKLIDLAKKGDKAGADQLLTAMNSEMSKGQTSDAMRNFLDYYEQNSATMGENELNNYRQVASSMANSSQGGKIKDHDIVSHTQLQNIASGNGKTLKETIVDSKTYTGLSGVAATNQGDNAKNNYALAQEHAKNSKNDKAIEQFKTLNNAARASSNYAVKDASVFDNDRFNNPS